MVERSLLGLKRIETYPDRQRRISLSKHHSWREGVG
jgi:hypothetical protein